VAAVLVFFGDVNCAIWYVNNIIPTFAPNSFSKSSKEFDTSIGKIQYNGKNYVPTGIIASKRLKSFITPDV
jgi:hypothetical protein